MDKNTYSSVLLQLKSCLSTEEVPSWPAHGWSPPGRTGPSTAPHATHPTRPSPSSSRLVQPHSWKGNAGKVVPGHSMPG